MENFPVLSLFSFNNDLKELVDLLGWQQNTNTPRWDSGLSLTWRNTLLCLSISANNLEKMKYFKLLKLSENYLQHFRIWRVLSVWWEETGIGRKGRASISLDKGSGGKAKVGVNNFSLKMHFCKLFKKLFLRYVFRFLKKPSKHFSALWMCLLFIFWMLVMWLFHFGEFIYCWSFHVICHSTNWNSFSLRSQFQILDWLSAPNHIGLAWDCDLPTIFVMMIYSKISGN